jgi:high-affinity iron transporter
VKTGVGGVAARLRALGSESAAPTAGGSAFVQSLFVLLREGFEAILVLSLLIGVLRKTGRTDAIRLVYRGAGAAVVASLLLAAIATFVFREMGAAREAFEGFTLLASVVVLFFTSYWLISRVEGRRWAMFVKHQIEGVVQKEAALEGGKKGMAIAMLSFLVVFREGAETVLFYAGLFASAHGAAMEILAGIAAGAIGLVFLFWATIKGGAKLPVRPFFAVTGALLYLLAFKFAGDGFAELQASGMVARTALTWIPSSAALQNWLGIYPTAQTATAQAVLVFAVVAGLAWTMMSKPQEPAAG